MDTVTDSSQTVTLADIEAARLAAASSVSVTPVFSSRTFSDRTGGKIWLKAENLQQMGSFKVRGATSKLGTLSDEQLRKGVVCASAGNHGQAVAAAAKTLGVRCEVFVPRDAALGKIDAARSRGAILHVGGESVEDCISRARSRAREVGLTFIHPFDDPAIIAGQGTIGLELLEQVSDLKRVVIPVGGGGLASGVAIALKENDPTIEVVGVQAAACDAMVESIRQHRPVVVPSRMTIADGIAVKRPGAVTLPLIEHWLDDIVSVDEDEIAEAMVLLMQRCKLVVEGAGAAAVAGLLGGLVAPAQTGSTVAILSGGNVDVASLAAIARRHETQAGRRLVVITRLDDRPGALAKLVETIADANANILEVTHVREGLDLHVRETAVELVLETRGHDHVEYVLDALDTAGYYPRPVQ